MSNALPATQVNGPFSPYRIVQERASCLVCDTALDGSDPPQLVTLRATLLKTANFAPTMLLREIDDIPHVDTSIPVILICGCYFISTW